MLRSVLVWIGALLVLVGIAICLASRTAAGLGAILFGGILSASILLEHRGYQRIKDHPPGPDWQPTDEHFLDPGTDTPVTVYFHPRSGKRAYVRSQGG